MPKHHNKRFKESMALKLKENGRVLKVNTFETQKGVYRVELVFMDGSPYYVKYKNGLLVEAVSIDNLCGAERYFYYIKQKKKDGNFDYLSRLL